MSFKQIHGANLYYELAGVGQQTLVLIHGNVASSRWWDPMWRMAAEKFQVLRVDLRGCGKSEYTGNGNCVKQYSQDISTLLDDLKLENVTLVGHSLGGAVVMEMVSANPKRYQGQVLINSSPIEGLVTPDERKPLIQSVMQDRNLMKMALAAIVPTAANGDFFESLVDDAMIAGPTWIPNYESLADADYRSSFKTLSIPTLILYGDQDSLISIDMMERTQEAIAGSKMIVYKGIGHSPNVECPDRVIQDIENFLAS